MFWKINCSLAFLLSVFCAGIVIPQILLIAFRKKLFDMPNERKIHHSTVPRLGGIAFKPVICFSMAVLSGSALLLGHYEITDQLFGNARTLLFGYCALLLLYLSGMADDLIGIRYKAKFVIQILCGLMLIAGGVWIDDFHGLFGLHSIPFWFGYPFTILLTVFIINAINLIDGIDGLASGLSSCACIFYGIAFFYTGQYIFSMLSFATLGVLVPFYYYNVFGNPVKQRKIFMGDTGSLTIGIILCLLSIRLAVTYHAAPGALVNPFVVAFTPLLVPCLDVVRVYLHRIRDGKNPFLPDKNHIHHKLLAIGMKQRMAMATIITVSIVFTLFNIILSYLGIDINIIIISDILIWTISNVGLTRAINKRCVKDTINTTFYDSTNINEQNQSTKGNEI